MRVDVRLLNETQCYLSGNMNLRAVFWHRDSVQDDDITRRGQKRETDETHDTDSSFEQDSIRCTAERASTRAKHGSDSVIT